MDNNVDVNMDTDASAEAISLSPSASRTSWYNSPISPVSQGRVLVKDMDSSSEEEPESKLELEEGEIDSDVSSSPAHSPAHDTKGLFREKTHKKYSGDSDTSDEMSTGSRSSLKGRNAADEKSQERKNSGLSEGNRGEPPMSDDGEDYQDVNIMSSTDEEMSDADKGDPNVEEPDDSGENSHAVSENVSSEYSNDESIEQEARSRNQKEVNISDRESSAEEDLESLHSGRSSNAEHARGKRDADKQRSDSESDSELEEVTQPSKDDKPKSLSFKKSKQSREKDSSSKATPGSQKRSDNESDNDVIDHLEITAPQQALLREAKKKISKDKSHGGRSGLKEERQRSKNKEKKEDGKSREKERRDRKDNHGKYKERKYENYEKKTDRESARPRSPIEKKSHSLVEEDLRRKLLQKRSTRDEIVVKKDQREYRETYRKDEKNPRQEKVEKRREEIQATKSKKDEREKSSDSSLKKSKATKEVKDGKEKGHKKEKEKEKSPKVTSVDKGKKRRREKTKSEVKRKKNGSDFDSSEDDEKQNREIRKPATKRPRSADQTTSLGSEDRNMTDQNKEFDVEDGKENNYDDISPASSIEMSPPPSPIELKKPTYYPAIMGCRDVKEFQWLNKIEEGTYGVVYRARDNRTDEVVALKRLKMEKEKEGFPITSLREINTLLKAQHPNIVTVREIVVGSNMDKIYIVMDYVEHDLKALMETMTQPFLVGEVKTLIIQLLRGVQHMHDNWILHRDIKASNLLLSHKGILKIGDFGLAREYGSPLKQYTTIVVTLWYRAPELLLGGKEYATAIDLWSCGCVLAELLTMKPLFPGKSEIDQINRIFKELGTPNDKIWPGPPSYSEYPMVKKTNFANHPYNVLRQKFGATLTDKGFHLLNKLLTYDPSKRITAEDALVHEFFEESPLPVDPSMFPTWPAKSELGHRAARKHNASPKAPEGGAAASKVANEDSNSGFHMPAATKGYSAKGAGFNLKF